MVFNVSVSDALTDEERALYNSLCSAKKEDKDILRQLYHEKIRSFKNIRVIANSKIYQDDGTARLNKVIAGFENEAVRLCKSFVFDKNNPKQIPLIKEFVIMDCRNLLILEQIVERGIIIDGQKYIVYSSSANQQKEKQVCLMQEQFYHDNERRLLCGLTLDIINKNGGCNTGKFLAYTSLIFSKSVEYPCPIRIDEVLVLPEFITNVIAKVNYLDMDSQSIEEKETPVPVNHMDGAGMFLPDILPQAAQIRGGYIKGCIFPFDFRQFIIEKIESGEIKEDAYVNDAWGNPVSITHIRDNVKIILNDSQLKMRKYYNSWIEYKEKFKENGLQICINNTLHYPETDNPLTKSAYQFYQTIPRKNMTDDRIEKLCKNTIDIINNYKTDGDAALEIFGVAENDELEPFHACIRRYPDMVYDPYVRNKIKNKIEKIRKEGRAGKPFIKGFYNYICPDLYAACEYWFCGIKEPKGLIPADHVYNGFYNNQEIEEVCCLRSPHLSDCEHGIRKLVKTDECKRWFRGLDTVISTHDLLTKILQCDVDGDECLITHDEAFIDLLDRDKLPLYYEMKKAEPMEVNKKNIFECLKRSFENSKIGMISNALTKHLNAKEDIDLDFVRVMTAYNNFCIDYPKSQYMPILKNEHQRKFDELDDEPFPYFFQYAKGKKRKQCKKYSKENEKSNVNRISKYIMDATKKDIENVWKDDSQRGRFHPEYFQNNDCKVDRSSDTYTELIKLLAQLKQMDNVKLRNRLTETYNNRFQLKHLGYEPFYCYCNQKILSIVGVAYRITERVGIRKKAAEYLLDIEYFRKENRDKSNNKDILWNCFGDILYNNLCKNIEAKKNEIKKIKIKRLAYQSEKSKILDKSKKIEEVIEELKETYQVSITKAEYDYIMSIPCRKRSENDRLLLYMLLVQHKRKLAWLSTLESQESITDDNKSHFRIYVNSRGGKITRTTLDHWLGKNVVVAKRGLERLEKNKLIKIESCKGRDGKKYDKIYPLFMKNIAVDDSETAFVVKNRNPMFDLYLNNEMNVKVKYCELCGKPFYAELNRKTCSPDCSRKLELINKNKKAV